MSHTSTPSRSRLSRDALRLVSWAEALALSGSRLEDSYWEIRLGTQLGKLLLGKKNDAVDSALDYLAANNPAAYEILIEQAETHSESTRLLMDGQDCDVLLFSVPMVVWTRYQLPRSYALKHQLPGLEQALREHVLAPDARLALMPELVSFDQMPQSFAQTLEWTQRLGRAALRDKADTTAIGRMPDNEGMLADARFVIGAILVPHGEALFRWQSETQTITREQCLQGWQQAATSLLTPLFTGCSVEYLQPDAFYVNSREADRRIRPLALRAAVTWLQTAAGLTANELRVAIAACGESQTDEYRIGFGTRHGNAVIYGCVWPVLSREEALAERTDTDQTHTPEEIFALLKEHGITDVRRVPGLYPPEFCDDCGAPFFPNGLGEMLHPELPEEIDINPVPLH